MVRIQLNEQQKSRKMINKKMHLLVAPQSIIRTTSVKMGINLKKITIELGIQLNKQHTSHRMLNNKHAFSDHFVQNTKPDNIHTK